LQKSGKRQEAKGLEIYILTIKKREFDEIKIGQEVERSILLVVDREKVFVANKCMQLTQQKD
jgi:hypothetical protein